MKNRNKVQKIFAVFALIAIIGSVLGTGAFALYSYLQYKNTPIQLDLNDIIFTDTTGNEINILPTENTENSEETISETSENIESENNSPENSEVNMENQVEIVLPENQNN